MSEAGVRRLRAELAVAWRYLRSARDDALIHQLSRITVAGLAIGVAALILALSVLTGFQEHLLGDVLQRSPGLQVEMAQADASDALVASLRSVEGVAGVQVLMQGQGWLRVRGDFRPIELIAYTEALPAWLLATQGSLSGSEPTAPDGDGLEPGSLGGIHLPAALAETLGIGVGDIVEIVTPKRSLSPLGGSKPSSRRLPVVGLLEGSRVQEVIRDRVALPINAGRGLLGPGGTRLDLALAPGANEERIATEVHALVETELGPGHGANLVTWRDQHASLLFVLNLEKAAVFLSVALIVLVASFALVSALALILSAKRQELGVLSAIGLSRKRIRRLFLLLGAMLATSGAVVGGISGALIAWALDRFELIPLPGDVFVVDHVPFSLRAPELAAVLAATLLVTMVAAAFGARGATSWTPIEALKR